MRKGNLTSKIFGIAFVSVMIVAVLPFYSFDSQRQALAQRYSASLETTISIAYDFPKPRIEKKWDSRMGKADFSVPSTTIERPSLPTDGYVSATIKALHQWGEAC